MVMASLFALLLLAVVVAWLGKRTVSIYIFIASFLMGIGVFFHHMTSVIGLSL